MHKRKFSPYLSGKGLLLAVTACIAGIFIINTWFCFLPIGKCRQNIPALSQDCRKWNEAERDMVCGEKDGYVKSENITSMTSNGYSCLEASVALDDDCCSGWYYCTKESCQDRGYKDSEKKDERFYKCETCSQGGETFYKCEEKPCNYDEDNNSTLNDECDSSGSKYCIREKAACGIGSQWVADETRKAGTQQCGKCQSLTPPCEGCVWEDELENGCVTCIEVGQISGKKYYKCTAIEEYNIPSNKRTIQHHDDNGECYAYEGPVQASGGDRINCYKKVKKPCSEISKDLDAGCPSGASTIRVGGCYECENVGLSGTAICWSCHPMRDYKLPQEWSTTACYDTSKDDVKTSWDNTTCIKRTEISCSCPKEFPNYSKPHCFTEVNGPESEGTNIKTLGGTRCYKSVSLTCPSGEEYDELHCKCVPIKCPKGMVSAPAAGCNECSVAQILLNGTVCYTCKPMEGFVKENALASNKCYEILERASGSDGSSCVKTVETDCACPIDFPEASKPTCFDETYGQEIQGENIKTVGKITCYKRINKACTDPYQKWSDEECRCVHSACPSEYPLSELPDTCQICEAQTVNGQTCFKCTDLIGYKPAEEWADNVCYDETKTEYQNSAKGTKNKCVKKVAVPCACPASHPYITKPKCFDAKNANGTVYEGRADGVKCYSGINPVCTPGWIYNDTKCACETNGCSAGISFYPEDLPHGCHDCKATGQILSNGMACYICAPSNSEAGYTEGAGSGCASNKIYNQDGNEQICHKKGSTAIEKSCKVIGYSEISWDTPWIIYEVAVYKTIKCDIPGIEDVTEEDTDTTVGKPVNCNKPGKIIHSVSVDGTACSFEVERPSCPQCTENCPAGTYRHHDIPNLFLLGEDWNSAWIDSGQTACGQICYKPAEDCGSYTEETTGCRQCQFKKYCGENKYYDCTDLDGYKENRTISNEDGWDCKQAGIIQNGIGERKCCRPLDCAVPYSVDCKAGIHDMHCVSCVAQEAFSGNDVCYQRQTEPLQCGPYTVSTNGNDVSCGKNASPARVLSGQYSGEKTCGPTTYYCYECICNGNLKMIDGKCQ